MQFINKFRNFMYGRYGIDELYGFLLKIYIVLSIINIFLSSKIIFILEIFLLFIMFYRIFSKKIHKRRQENIKFLSVRKELIKPFQNMKRNFYDKEFIYRKCSKCKKTLKLPIPFERGIKHTKCPNCKKRITFFTLRKQKIKIIKKQKDKKV